MKMGSNRGSVSSIHSLSVPLSVKNQTKGKFDALLKTKRKNAKSMSKEQLLNDCESTTASSENLLDKEPAENTTGSENYILQKFLSHETKQEKNKAVSTENMVKPPVPKPRTKKCISPAISQATFEVVSPKMVKKDDLSSSSNKTYNVEEIGDVLVDNNTVKPKIVKKIAKSRKSKEESNSVEAQTSSETEDTKTIKSQDSIKYVDEKKQETDVKESQKLYAYNQIMEIIIHKTDRLQLSSLVVHPMVKIHMVDAATGKYFPKSDKTRSVVFFYENSENDYISPIMTHVCNLQEKRILYPSWEETILINEDYEYIKKESNRIILFFEVLDFLSFGLLHQASDKDSGWHNMAFAFLKLSAKNGSLNLGRKLRLQLYYSCQTKKNKSICSPWIWWKKKKLKKYPSTLYVTIKSVISPTKITETLRSQAPMQQEISRVKINDNQAVINTEIADSKLDNSTSETDVKWSRRPHEICKLPNKSLVEFDSYDHGCFIMKFSHSGVYLACSIQIENLFYVAIFSVITLREVNKFSCHQALIYDIKWSHDDSLLVLASADNTVSVFHASSSSLLQILPHPSFVYTCDINDENTVVTGSFDGTIRIWPQSQNVGNEFNLFQELEGHSGYVTSLCFSKSSSIFSADSSGVINEWQKEGIDWVLKREIKLLDLKETVINHLLLFPKEKRLLVQSRDSLIRIIDIKSGCILHWLRGSVNKRFQLFSTISPCGTFVFSGSENGVVHVWNSKNGHEVATYDHKNLTMHCVQFHPHDNILAMSHYGKKNPILLYFFDQNLQQPAVGITIKEESYNYNSDPLKLESKFKKYAIKKSDEKLDFKGVLQKMDLVILSQKN